ncbi:hypothetical protein I35_4762 [Burkholderia cenocepacia H111]|nr:uncharacterized protein BCN122_II0925 [Burkholderia cenocepacia]CDN62598.1 hypothetical protein I35_4762 [Burkholderia cenocepacia H111]
MRLRSSRRGRVRRRADQICGERCVRRARIVLFNLGARVRITQ